MKHLAPLTLSLLLLGCGSPVSLTDRAALLVESDAASYELADKAVPSFTLEHGGGPDVVISGCPEAPSAILERETPAGWTEEGSRGLICAATQTLQVDTLASGESRTFQMAAWRTGTYRIRVLIGRSAAAPERTLLSNEFDVH